MSRPSVAAPAQLRVPLSLLYFATLGTLGLYAPYFPLWLDAHGFQGLSLGAIAALAPVGNLIGPPLVGAAADRYGARGNLLGWGSLLAALSMAGLCVAEAIGYSRHFAVVFALVLGFSAFRSPLILLADRISLEHGGNYGQRRIFGSLGFLLAAAAFGRFCPPAWWRWLPATMVITLLATHIASGFMPRRGPVSVGSSRARFAALLGQRRFVLFLGCLTLFGVSHSSYDLCGSLWFRDLGASRDMLGWLWATGVLAEIVLFAKAAPYVSKFGGERLLVLSFALAALRWLVTALLPGPAYAFWVQPLHAASFGLAWLGSLEFAQRWAAPHALGSAQGLLMAASAAGSACGMLVWGPLYAAYGGSGVFLVAAALSVLAALFTYVFLYRSSEGTGSVHLPAQPRRRAMRSLTL
jgi:PPP family 3-phenylpropionic acid transporter